MGYGEIESDEYQDILEVIGLPYTIKFCTCKSGVKSTGMLPWLGEPLSFRLQAYSKASTTSPNSYIWDLAAQCQCMKVDGLVRLEV